MAENRTVSRREFLKLAGVAGATVGLAGGLGGLLAACGGTEETTTTAGVTTTAGPHHHRSRSDTTQGATTTVSAGAGRRPRHQARLCSPKTGNFALFAVSDDWIIARANQASRTASSRGDGKQPRSRSSRPTASPTTDRASQVAGDLVTNSKVDMLLASGTPDTANPVVRPGRSSGMPRPLQLRAVAGPVLRPHRQTRG